MSTSFSGIGCPEVAARILTETAAKKGFCSKKWHVSQCFTHSWPASHTFGLGVWGSLCGSHTGSHTGSLRNCLLLRPKVSYLRAIEWDKNCQKALLMQDSDQHIFGDITTVFPANPLAPKMVQCSRHGCPCPATAIADVEVAGPPCIFFSRMDKRLGVGDVRYSCHLSWLQGDPRVELEKQLGDIYQIQWAQMDPVCFGIPCSRPRVWPFSSTRRGRPGTPTRPSRNSPPGSRGGQPLQAAIKGIQLEMQFRAKSWRGGSVQFWPGWF